jgi:hypothetical protein
MIAFVSSFDSVDELANWALEIVDGLGRRLLRL